MKWETYYEKFYDWADSTQISHISSITDFTFTNEIIEIAENLDEQGASKLIRKALSQAVSFDTNDVLALCEYTNKETTLLLIKQCDQPFTAEQIEQITDATLLWEEDILPLLSYDIPALSSDEDWNDGLDDDFDTAPPQKSPGILTKLGLGLLGAKIFDKIFN